MFDRTMQCNCDDDVTKYKRVVRQWAEDMVDPFWFEDNMKGSNPWPPHTRRYTIMSNVEARVSLRFCGSPRVDPDNLDLNDLIPETAADIPETAAWLTTLLHCIHRKVRCVNSGT